MAGVSNIEKGKGVAFAAPAEAAVQCCQGGLFELLRCEPSCQLKLCNCFFPVIAQANGNMQVSTGNPGSKQYMQGLLRS